MKHLKKLLSFSIVACMLASSAAVISYAEEPDEEYNLIYEEAEYEEEYTSGEMAAEEYEMAEEIGEEYAYADEWDIADTTEEAEQQDYEAYGGNIIGGYTFADDAYIEEYAANISWPAGKIQTYVKSTKNDTKVYKTATSNDGSYGTIYASDLITLNKRQGSRFYVTYPTSKGSKTGWIEKSAITSSEINVAKKKYTSSGKITAYRRAGGGAELGYISKGDTVYEIASSNGYTQVIYPVSGGYKMGWINSTPRTKTQSFTSSEESKITDRLNKMMNGSYGKDTYKVGTKYAGPFASEQCKGFAKQVHKILFGYNIGSTNSNDYTIGISSSNTRLVGSVTSMTEANLKKTFSQARPGDFVQIRRKKNTPHSAIVVSKSSNGITLYEANLNGNNGITKKTYKWQDFIDKNSAMSLYTAKNYTLQ